jgi:hypothetical protein
MKTIKFNTETDFERISKGFKTTRATLAKFQNGSCTKSVYRPSGARFVQQSTRGPPPARILPCKGMEDGERRIQIARDYSDGNLTQFSDKFPAELENLGIDEELFQSTISQGQQLLRGGRNGSLYFHLVKVNCGTFWEGCLGCLSFFTLYLCVENKYSQSHGRTSLAS